MNGIRQKLANVPPSWRAIVSLVRDELSFRVLLVCAVIVLIFSWTLRISTLEFMIVILTIGMVLSVEALNTAIEELCDHVTPEEHPKIGIVKDLGSGASLLMLVAAAVVGLIIFAPYLLRLL